ncbi:minor tail protein [Mycobacterium phage Refuge]|uniref:Minor tail protein n=1 Tax=Mycobacterium phage Refuge TaxID=2517967 RepID=A0A482JE95_9CAUD|nr:minor tail protein [Mycobacterium phage Refuge]QBP31054.1 minor tail protein [Mycobacterium phage Refuge]
MSPDVIVEYLPENWVGLFAVVMFILYVGSQVIEKFEGLAKILPGGQWWHERQKAKRGRRVDMVADDNEIIRALQEQVTSIVTELAQVRETLRTFTAWSVYDARWHHQALVEVARDGVLLPDHLDYFAFETLWKVNPIEAARLPAMSGRSPE